MYTFSFGAFSTANNIPNTINAVHDRSAPPKHKNIIFAAIL